MNKKVFKDNFFKDFTDEEDFLEFVTQRDKNTAWLKWRTKDLRLLCVSNEKSREQKQFDNSIYLEEIEQIYRDCDKEDVLQDTKENTCLILCLNENIYPVRNSALKTIKERACIKGTVLDKIKKDVLAFILNECFKVTNGLALIKFCDEKISAIHGGDNSEYAILPISELFEKTSSYLKKQFNNCTMKYAYYDHNIVSALWRIEDNNILKAYKEQFEEYCIDYSNLSFLLRLKTSDTGISGANLFPMLFDIGTNKSIPLLSKLKLEHKNRATLEDFNENLNMIFSQYKKSLKNLLDLLKIEINYPINTMIEIMKRIGISKKYGMAAIEKFKAQNGEKPSTAYDIYFGIAEVPFLMQCDKIINSKIIQSEEIVARALTIDWKKYDIAGDIRW